MNFSKKPAISIVVPVLNGLSTIERTLNSLVSQKYSKLQIIIVDGGSTDGTHQIIKKFKHFIDDIVQEPDDGQSHALNKGFSLAEGDWLGWLCADDELAPNALENLANEAIEVPECCVISGACQRYRQDGSHSIAYPPQTPEFRLSFGNVLDQPSTFWDRTAHKLVEKVDETLHLAMDWDRWCKLRTAGAHFQITKKVLGRYYFTGNNKTCGDPYKNLAEALTILSRHGALSGDISLLYRDIYTRYDLNGCLDVEGHKSPLYSEWNCYQSQISQRYGPYPIQFYSLNWISRQMRGLPYF